VLIQFLNYSSSNKAAKAWNSVRKLKVCSLELNEINLFAWTWEKVQCYEILESLEDLSRELDDCIINLPKLMPTN